ncbi:hypothetical protein AB205_0046540 [Aquarana catesbeiana]|uniref:Uncharacterized protein n=1 Tax=Aquarana catesbeiana TaxID=8400 RepID=A0A2G9R462_AQUCT|nr:hypothetical protein AB205_0046540 [Aquarana catesbeiana]
MSFSDYNCSLIVEPVSLLFLFCSSIAHKCKQLGGCRGKQVPLLPHEAELLVAVGEDEINQLLAHQDHIQAHRRRRQRAEEQESSTSSTCTAEAEQEVEETCPVEAAGDAAEQPDAADPGSEVFILQLHPVDEGLDLPAFGWADCPSSPVVSTGHVLLHPSSISPHLDTPIGASSPMHPSPPAPEQVHIPHSPEPHVNDYL